MLDLGLSLTSPAILVRNRGIKPVRIVPAGADMFYVVTTSSWGTALAHRFQRNMGGASSTDIGAPWQPWRRTGTYELATVASDPTSPAFAFGEDIGAFDYTMLRGTIFISGGSYHGGETITTESLFLDTLAVSPAVAGTGAACRLERASLITWGDATTASIVYSLDIAANGVLLENISMTSASAAAAETYLGMEIASSAFTRGSFGGGAEVDISAAGDYAGGTAGTVRLRAPATGHTIESVSNAPGMAGYTATFIRTGSAATSFRKKIYYRKGSTSGTALGTKTAQRTITFGKTL